VDARVVVVTGSGTGIGAAVARLLCRRGHAVVLVGRRLEPLRALAEELDAGGGPGALAVSADLGVRDGPEQVVRATEERFGRLDVVVNNAAAFRLKPFGEFALDDFDEHVAVNVRAPYFLVHHALPLLRRSPAPAVVNISSAAAVMYRPTQSVYGLTKAALEHLTKQLAAELAPDRIRVNCVRPGPTATPIHQAVEDPQARIAALARMVPLGRVGEPEEVALWVVRLADPEAAWVTGTVISVDGGRVLGPPESI
jgi:NAD(P)-dependent dehydrogenase (short-subunit alcohol dehydrogenase family)